MASIDPFLPPKGGASLLLSFRLPHHTTLILGSGVLAASRAFSALDANSAVIVLAKGGIKSACDEIKWRAEQKQLECVDWDCLGGNAGSSHEAQLAALDSFLNERSSIALACITDTVIACERRNRTSAKQLYRLFQAHNIFVNTTDMAELCDFTFMSSHRFEDPETGAPSPLQIGVTTNGQGCRMAGRLRREIVAKLPRDVGVAVSRINELRTRAKASADALKDKRGDIHDEDIAAEELGEDTGVSTPNRPVPSRRDSETEVENTRRRMQWVAQVSEYWPLSKLSKMSEDDIREVLEGKNMNVMQGSECSLKNSQHSLSVSRPGRILLVGSGPGHPSLLTLATHTALSKLADLILSDKLVPDAVLALIPKTVPIRIAKKFPGNSEGAQTEMMEAAVEAARRGLTVVRLKQGDPVIYGRAGEEVLYFRSHGFEPLVIPGVSSALAAPIFAGIPVTQRGVAESFVVCTGVGRRGKDVQLPSYDRGRTLVILMGIARLELVVSALMDTKESSKREGMAYPPHTPIAIIERASMPDQRVLSSTLQDIVRALANSGEQRPPGMMVVGWAVLALAGKGDVGVLDEMGEGEDEERVARWLAGDDWKLIEGLADAWAWV